MKMGITIIPGIGKTFAKDFERIGIVDVSQFAGQKAETIYETLCQANQAENHKTSKNYLYVIRMCIYYANGGRDPQMLKWNKWRDTA